MKAVCLKVLVSTGFCERLALSIVDQLRLVFDNWLCFPQVFSAKARAATSTHHEDSEISPEDPAILRVTPSGAWLTKVNALVRRVLWLERSAPLEKCLIFSQFPEALSFVRNALTINRVKCASITGNSKKVRILAAVQCMRYLH